MNIGLLLMFSMTEAPLFSPVIHKKAMRQPGGASGCVCVQSQDHEGPRSSALGVIAEREPAGVDHAEQLRDAPCLCEFMFLDVLSVPGWTTFDK